MPAHFGGYDAPGPDAAVYNRDVTSLSYSYTTDKDQLSNYLPEGFEMIRPEVQVLFNQLREIDWMAGGYYNLISIGVPARFRGKHDHAEGLYTLVIWENNTTPILGGREETGMPKIYADIQDLHISPPHYSTNASYDGNTFLELNMAGEKPMEAKKLAEMKAQFTNINALGWRYIPKIEGPGADLSQFTLYPQGYDIASIIQGSGTIRWTPLRWEQNPMQWHIIRALAELPIITMGPAYFIKGCVVLKPSQGRVLK
jgi:acetoacetate decarboxylase